MPRPSPFLDQTGDATITVGFKLRKFAWRESQMLSRQFNSSKATSCAREIAE